MGQKHFFLTFLIQFATNYKLRMTSITGITVFPVCVCCRKERKFLARGSIRRPHISSMPQYDQQKLRHRQYVPTLTHTHIAYTVKSFYFAGTKISWCLMMMDMFMDTFINFQIKHATININYHFVGILNSWSVPTKYTKLNIQQTKIKNDFTVTWVPMCLMRTEVFLALKFKVEKLRTSFGEFWSVFLGYLVCINMWI